jgi:hypothetical protein
MSHVPGTIYSGKQFFQYVVVWVEYLPWCCLLDQVQFYCSGWRCVKLDTHHANDAIRIMDTLWRPNGSGVGA